MFLPIPGQQDCKTQFFGTNIACETQLGSQLWLPVNATCRHHNFSASLYHCQEALKGDSLKGEI